MGLMTMCDGILAVRLTVLATAKLDCGEIRTLDQPHSSVTVSRVQGWNWKLTVSFRSHELNELDFLSRRLYREHLE
jgi:hypothetical protein